MLQIWNMLWFHIESFIAQFPAIVICPSWGFRGDPWGFTRQYFDMLDTEAQENTEMFRFLPQDMYSHRYEMNKGIFG